MNKETKTLDEIYRPKGEAYSERDYSHFTLSHHDDSGEHIDTNRHYRMLNFMTPILGLFAGRASRWLTIGDALAREAIFLKKQGVPHVTCSGLRISPEKKQLIKEHVDDCRELNAEKMEEIDADFILCKEAFHHFHRPLKGLYEMLDHARFGIVLIEPHETRYYSHGVWQFVEDSFLVDEVDPCDNYEVVGNYKYDLNVREVCKAAWALFYPHVIVRGFNDPTGDLYDDKSDVSSPLRYESYLQRCANLDKLGDSNQRPYNLVVCAILKEELSTEDRGLLKDFRIIDRPCQ